ncbi:hypothetical protein FHR81_005549 [Actinoalloteichus hoggarensis]|uniref:Pyridoxamine 5'-phosphate oxidase n=1 Tax=Actinoalloteichus hoggarensis TaxID=1470176 RepID=A0A221W4P5_9PSEU|nr:pyridoxamine 5'-phosphate oxidase family protein [Actinoalloteichus hoggarensis]ASO20683.1 Pyridoxamine 5'-phosphate oxidase [Actinoalloteichus hoggarensis]MBB5924464.1 hypothetical protein [Actinoalloteichus hoggarensis]
MNVSTVAEGPALTWAEIDSMLTESRSYWVCTVRPDLRPHAVPVWGVWRRGSLLISTPESTVKARNIAVNRAVTVHLESADDVVVVDGRARVISDSDELTDWSTALTEKYGGLTGVTYDLVASASAGMRNVAIDAKVVRAWRAGEMFHAVRWVADGTGGMRLADALSSVEAAQGGVAR